MLAIPEQECTVCHQQCGARDATRAGGRASRVSQATCGSGGRQPLRAGYWCRRRRPTCGGWRVSLFVAARGDGGKGAGWLVISPRPHVHSAALLGKPDPAICPALDQYSPPAPLGLAPELQIHEICSVRRTRLVRYWMDNPLNPGTAYVPSVPPLRRNLRGRVFILSSLLGVSRACCRLSRA